jgi:membrane protein DedA with SNARE-associated domain
MTGFAFARFIGRNWVEDRMPARLRLWDERLAGRGVTGVIVFRLIFFLNPASHWALGLSSVPAPAAFFGTMIGFAGPIALWTYFGAEILVWFEAQSAWVWVAVITAIVAFLAFRKIRKRTNPVERA